MLISPKSSSSLFFNQLYGGRHSKAVLGDLLSIIINNSMATFKISGVHSLLEKEVNRLEKLYKNQEIPRPNHWGGYLLSPFKIEFWQGRASRLHDRCLYELHGESWKMYRLAP